MIQYSVNIAQIELWPDRVTSIVIISRQLPVKLIISSKNVKEINWVLLYNNLLSVSVEENNSHLEQSQAWCVLKLQITNINVCTVTTLSFSHELVENNIGLD